MFGNFYQGKNVFVTGHTGFKGSWLSAWLLKLGAKVTGYALPPAYEESHFELLGLDRRMRHIVGNVCVCPAEICGVDQGFREILSGRIEDG